MDSSVIILGKEDDFHIGLVKPHLAEEPTIIDLGAVERGFSFHCGDKLDTVQAVYDGRPIDTSAFTAVWYRQINLRKMRDDLAIEPPDQYEYALSAHAQQNEAFVELLNPQARWLSLRSAVRRAEYKPLQLRAAAAAGFRNIPPTLFTSSAEAAGEFLAAHGRCAVKPISLVMPRGQDQHTIVTDGTDITLDGLHLTPHIIQPCIPPVKEVRVATVRTETFASEMIDTAPDGGDPRLRDYRLAFGKGTFLARPHRLPQWVKDACVQYLRIMGLNAGYSDLIVDANGDYWYLETNPNGEWGFMDEEALDGIAHAHARYLQTA